MGHVVHHHPQRAPDREALVTATTRLTFAEPAEQVQQFSRAALAHGLRPGDRAGIWAPNNERWVVAALGLVSVGVVLVTVNTRFKGEEASHVLAATSVLVVDDLFLTGLLGSDPVTLLAHVPELVVRTSFWSAFTDQASEVDPLRAVEAAGRQARRPERHHLHVGDDGQAEGRGRDAWPEHGAVPHLGRHRRLPRGRADARGRAVLPHVRHATNGWPTTRCRGPSSSWTRYRATPPARWTSCCCERAARSPAQALA